MHASPGHDLPDFLDAALVASLLDLDACFDAVREAMISLSTGRSRQHLRTIINLGPQQDFGVMPGVLAIDGYFGAKLVSVWPDPAVGGRRRHRGIIALFARDGSPVAIVDAEEITATRTAAASAVATDALARPDASRLALVGAGLQAERHARAIARIRPLTAISIWSRDADRARPLAASLERELLLPVVMRETVADAVRDADIVCTLTGATNPLLFRDDVADGVHVNAVGSSVPSAAEIDGALVARARFFADSAEGVRAQGGEWRRALDAGLVDPDHLLGEIGEVLSGTLAGRTDSRQVTLYKSLGHIVQDLAAAVLVHRRYRNGT